jgi:hypothetical protein
MPAHTQNNMTNRESEAAGKLTLPVNEQDHIIAPKTASNTENINVLTVSRLI